MSRALSVVVLAVAILASAVIAVFGPTAQPTPDASSSLPTRSDSFEAARVQAELAPDDLGSVVAVYDRDGAQLTDADLDAIDERALALSAEFGGGGAPAEVVLADDEQAALAIVSIGQEGPGAPGFVDGFRAEAASGLPDGLRSAVGGGVGANDDLEAEFAEIGLPAVLVLLALVGVLMLVFRRPGLVLAATAVSLSAALVSVKLAGALTAFALAYDNSNPRLTFAVAFALGIAQSLLLSNRYRRELPGAPDHRAAIARAVRATAPVILVGAGTVVVLLLTLLLATNPVTVATGVFLAGGVITTTLATLIVFPSVLALGGRRILWPERSPTDAAANLWSRAASGAAARPIAAVLASVALLALATIPLTGLRLDPRSVEQISSDSDAVTAQQRIAEHFPAGEADPTIVVTPEGSADAVASAVAVVTAVDRVEERASGDGQVVLDVVLDVDPASTEATDVVQLLRDAVEAVEPEALVGGVDAEALDSRAAAASDLRLLVPLWLALTLVLLSLALRSVVAAVAVTLSLGLTYAAAVGLGSLIAGSVFGVPALGVPVLILTFAVFVVVSLPDLIALMRRFKKESDGIGALRDPSSALSTTGAAVAGAGLVSATLFLVLVAVPPVVQIQLGVLLVVAFLLSTVVLRAVLLPAVASLAGGRFWWPSRSSRGTANVGDGRGTA